MLKNIPERYKTSLKKLQAIPFHHVEIFQAIYAGWGSNPPQDGAEEKKARDIHGVDDTDRDRFIADALHIENHVGDQEKSEITEEKDEVRNPGIPPTVIPGEGIEGVQHNLHNRAKSGIDNGKKQPIGDTQDFQAFILGKHLGKDDSRNGEHETDLDIETDENEICRFSRCAPDGSIGREMEDKAVPDFI